MAWTTNHQWILTRLLRFYRWNFQKHLFILLWGRRSDVNAFYYRWNLNTTIHLETKIDITLCEFKQEPGYCNRFQNKKLNVLGQYVRNFATRTDGLDIMDWLDFRRTGYECFWLPFVCRCCEQCGDLCWRPTAPVPEERNSGEGGYHGRVSPMFILRSRYTGDQRFCEGLGCNPENEQRV